MYKSQKVLGIIAARGGSKRVPRKNIMEISGKPLVYYTIESAMSSKHLTRLILSSDDGEIIDFAKGMGVEVPFVRPALLATDSASSADVVVHALEFMERNEVSKFDYACLLEPCSPLRAADDIDRAITNLIESGYESTISLVPSDCGTPYRIRYILNNEVEFAFEDKYYDCIKNKNNYPKAYIPGGGIFCSKVDSIKKEKKLFAGRVLPYVMDKFHGIDINEMDDFVISECLLRNKNYLSREKT